MLRACSRCLGRPTRNELMRNMDSKPHTSGEFSMAVVQAHSSLRDQTQVFVSPFATHVGVYDGHGGPEASRFANSYLLHFCTSLELRDIKILRDWIELEVGVMPCLHALKIIDCPKLVCLPSLQHHDSLLNLEINYCQELRSLPELSSSFMSGERRKLIIADCPLVVERCQVGGVDWEKIKDVIDKKIFLTPRTSTVLTIVPVEKDKILALDNAKEDLKRKVHAAIDKYAERELTSLAIARQEVPEKMKECPGGPWQFVTILPLFDPPRHDSAETIRKTLDLGDQLAIAKETGRRLGMGTNMYPSSTLLGQNKDSSIAALPVDELIEKADGFAGVFPEHKYEIVKNLQEKKHICGVTGDGVNDAPALKRADIGIAVADATDAARSASDIVLTEPGLSVIISVVLTSRAIFQRMKNYTEASNPWMHLLSF